MEKLAADILGKEIDGVDDVGGTVSITLSERITLEEQDAVTKAMEEKYPGQEILLTKASSLDAPWAICSLSNVWWPWRWLRRC